MVNLIKVLLFLFIVSTFACQETSTELLPQEKMSQKSKWNWGKNKEMELEHNVMMRDCYRTRQYEKALWHYEWIVSENPRLNPSVYIQGLLIYDKLISETDDQTKKARMYSEKNKIIKLKSRYFPNI